MCEGVLWQTSSKQQATIEPVFQNVEGHIYDWDNNRAESVIMSMQLLDYSMLDFITRWGFTQKGLI